MRAIRRQKRDFPNQEQGIFIGLTGNSRTVTGIELPPGLARARRQKPDTRSVVRRTNKFYTGRFKSPLKIEERLRPPARQPVLLLQALNGGQRYA